MVLEALIISSCIFELECSTAPRAYFLTRPELKTWAKDQTKMVHKHLKDAYLGEVVPVVVGFGLISTGNRVTIRITRNLSIRVSDTETYARLTWAF